MIESLLKCIGLQQQQQNYHLFKFLITFSYTNHTNTQPAQRVQWEWENFQFSCNFFSITNQIKNKPANTMGEWAQLFDLFTLSNAEKCSDTAELISFNSHVFLAVLAKGGETQSQRALTK